MLARNGFWCMGAARGATVLAQASRKLKGEHLHAVLALRRVPEPKPQRTELLLDLDHDRLRRDLMVGIPLQLGAERIDQLEPAVPYFDAAGHAGLVGRKVSFREDQWIALVENFGKMR